MLIPKSVKIKTFIRNAVENLIKHTKHAEQKKTQYFPKKDSVVPIINPPKYQPKIPT